MRADRVAELDLRARGTVVAAADDIERMRDEFKHCHNCVLGYLSAVQKVRPAQNIKTLREIEKQFFAVYADVERELCALLAANMRAVDRLTDKSAEAAVLSHKMQAALAPGSEG